MHRAVRQAARWALFCGELRAHVADPYDGYAGVVIEAEQLMTDACREMNNGLQGVHGLAKTKTEGLPGFATEPGLELIGAVASQGARPTAAGNAVRYPPGTARPLLSQLRSSATDALRWYGLHGADGCHQDGLQVLAGDLGGSWSPSPLRPTCVVIAGTNLPSRIPALASVPDSWAPAISVRVANPGGAQRPERAVDLQRLALVSDAATQPDSRKEPP